jgi:hypothetical protein
MVAFLPQVVNLFDISHQIFKKNPMNSSIILDALAFIQSVEIDYWTCLSLLPQDKACIEHVDTR